MTLTIFQWDEISGEVRTIDAPWFQEVDPQLFGEIPFMIQDGVWTDWQVDHVVDLPDGTRVVIESDERAHTSVFVTKEV